MRVWVDIYASDGVTRLGEGPLMNITQASVKRVLDGAGSISFSYPADDRRALETVQNERRAVIWVEHDETMRELGRGIIRDLNTTLADGGNPVNPSGPDNMDALSRYVVGRFVNFEDMAIEDIVNDLVARVPGWSATTESGLGLQTVRFSGASVLKGLLRMVEERGIHLRQGTTLNSIEIGAFGDPIGVQVANVEGLGHEIYDNDDLILIEKLTLKQSTQAIANRIIPLGAGEGVAAMTLALSTRSGSPYTIATRTTDGQLEYYIEDTASIALYGPIEKYVTFKEIGPVANTDAAKILAANALYDAAAAWLSRNSQEVTTYGLSGRKPRQTVRPGDKIRVTYKGMVFVDNMPVRYADVDDWFWVMSVEERATDAGLSISLEVNTIDRHIEDAITTLVGTLEAVDVRNVAVQTFPFYYQDSSERVVQGFPGLPPTYPAAKNAKFSLKFPNMMTDVVAVRFQIISRPLYTLTDENWNLSVPPSPLKYYYVYEGSNYPCDLGIIINGVDRTSALGGPWNPSGGNAAVDVTLDISTYILNATGGIFQTHTIEIYTGHKTAEWRVSSAYQSSSLDISNGIIEGKLLAFGTAQAILPT